MPPVPFWITVRDHDEDDLIRAGYDAASAQVDLDDAAQVALGDDLFMYADTRVAVRGWTHDVDVRVGVVEGRLAATHVEARQRDDGPPVTGEVLREVPVARLVNYAKHTVKVRRPHEGGGYESGPAWPSVEEGEYVARHGLDDETMRIVARAYRVAYLIGQPPTKTVERLFDLPRSTAGRWVAAAREHGYLSASRGPGKAGG